MTAADDAQADDRSAAAGEYVLGTLTGQERAAFERALASDGALLAAVYAWQDDLLPLAARVMPAEPAVGLWSAIEARLIQGQVPGYGGAVAASVAAAANEAAWRGRARRWRWASLAGLAASAVLSALWVLRTPAPSNAPRYLAVLQAPAGNATGWVVEVQAGGRLRLVPVGSPAPAPAGQSLQFWTKPEGAAGPTSLGLVQADRATELPVSVLPALGARQLFEVTLEPAAGSPLGRPTGPVLYVGRSVRL